MLIADALLISWVFPELAVREAAFGSPHHRYHVVVLCSRPGAGLYVLSCSPPEQLSLHSCFHRDGCYEIPMTSWRYRSICDEAHNDSEAMLLVVVNENDLRWVSHNTAVSLATEYGENHSST